jgi:hypothetical protein
METKERIDLLGVISIIAAITGALTPIGLAIGLIGVHQAKKDSRSPALSRFGWMFNLALIVLSIGWVISVLITGTYKASK